MAELLERLLNVDTDETVSKEQIVKEVNDSIISSRYTLFELDDQRPWGAFFRLNNSDADMFIEEFFPNLSPTEARLGRDDVELSPKILLVSPKQRLSWQYHNRRAERWAFLNEGAYIKSSTDNEDNLRVADAGEVVQIAATERHRLIGRIAYTLVAEIWQHTDPNNLSDEYDVVRLQDDFNRN